MSTLSGVRGIVLDNIVGSALVASVILLLCSQPASASPEDFYIEPLTTVGLGALGDVAVCPRADVVMTSSGNGLHLWNLEGELIRTLISGMKAYGQWSPDGTKIVASLEMKRSKRRRG